MNDYKDLIDRIEPLDMEAMGKAQSRVDSLVKPPGSLGKLEKIAVRLAGISGETNNEVSKKCTLVMAADNGIVEEGVASAPQEFTLMQSINMVKGVAAISVLSKQSGSDIKVVDIGINSDFKHEDIVDRKIRKGTSNFASGPAMTRTEAEEAINTGIEITTELIRKGYDLIGTGEMGIGNTSTSSAVVMSLSGKSAGEAVGKGAGLSDEAYEAKKRIIEDAIALNGPDGNDPVDVLSKVGGLDIAGLVGCYIAGAYNKIPIVMDGVISAAAAYIAVKLNKNIKGYIIPSHYSIEPAYRIVADEMGIEPFLNMDMRLGEGTGCPLMFHIIESACAMINNMATFEEMSFDESCLVDIRG